MQPLKMFTVSSPSKVDEEKKVLKTATYFLRTFACKVNFLALQFEGERLPIFA